MFLTLLRKDWRLAKPAFFLMIVLYFTPAFVGIAVAFYARAFEHQAPLLHYTADNHADVIGLLTAGFFLTILAAPAVAATQFGRERRDRSNEFLGALAITRRAVVFSKSLITAVLISLPILVTLLGDLSIALVEDSLTGGYSFGFSLIGLASALIVGVAGLAWILSCIAFSEVFASAIALAFSTACILTIYFAFESVGALRAIPASTREATMVWTVIAFFTFFAVAGFLSGTLIAFYRRAL